MSDVAGNIKYLPGSPGKGGGGRCKEESSSLCWMRNQRKLQSDSHQGRRQEKTLMEHENSD